MKEIDRTAEQLDDDAYLDTMAIRLDNLLGLAKGSQAYLQESGEDCFTYYPDEVPGKDARNKDAYYFVVNQKTVQSLYRMAFATWQDLKQHSPLGGELADDIVKSWMSPEPVVLEAKEDRDLL